MTTDRDPVVGAVLDLLPVDPPGPTFWADLEARLQGDVVDLGSVTAPRPLGDARHRRRRVAAAVLAAAAVVAVVVGAALRDDRDGVDTRPPVGPGPSATDATVPTSVAGELDRAEDAVRAWIAAVDAGDADAAWELVGHQSQVSIGGRAAFDDLMASALREGWGAWDQEGVLIDAVALHDGPSTTWMVTLRGTIAQEGDTTYRSAVLLVTNGPAGKVVEPFVPGPAVGLIEVPPAGDPIALPADEPIPLHVDGDALAWAVAIDGAAVPESALLRDGDGTIVGVRPGPLAAGPHTLAVAMASDGFTLAAHAISFQLEG